MSEHTSLTVSLDALIDKYSSPPSKQTFEIEYPDGEKLTCRLPERFGDWKEYEGEITRLWAKVQSIKVPEQWKPYLPISFQECVAVAALKFWTCEPTKVNDLLALKHVRLGGGAILRSLYTQIQTKIDHEGYERFVTEVDAEKKDFEPTQLEDAPQEPPPVTTESLLRR